MVIAPRGLVVTALCTIGLLVPAAASADQSYGDPEGDGSGAPDVTTVAVSNDNDGNVNFRISLAGGADLPTDGVLLLMIDTDRTSTTGGQEGEEVTIVIDGTDSSFDYGRWNGTKVDFAVQAQTMRVGFRTGAVEILVNKSELNNATTFDFWTYGDKWLADAVTAEDAAPDGAGVWTYALVTKAVALRAGPIGTRPSLPVAAKSFTIQFSAFRTATSAVVTSGVAQCTARIGAKTLKARARFIGSVARCDVVIPKGTGGKTLRGTIGISVPGGQVAKPFAYHIL